MELDITIPTLESNHSNPYHIGYDEIIINDFYNHINQEGNLRIFFSAKFGTGKSYFLEEFFKEKKEEYEVIKLYPINYSTASNNDIFELIKFDILFHLIMKRQETIGSDIQLPELSKLQAYIHQKFTIDGVDSSLALITALTSLADGSDIIVKVIPLIIGIYLEEKKKYKENLAKDNLDIADAFMFRINKNFKEYGDDEPITAIIKEALIKLSETKKTVLLIDDLDRLDPEHIFRILNIFGNHFSSSSGNKIYVNENKFGFNKVILVGDTKNIKGIFHHKYGSETDFEGYFSKYSSKTPYSFDVESIIIKNIDIVINNLKLPGYKNNNLEELTHFKIIVKKILLHFIKENYIKFRLLGHNNNFIPVKVRQKSIGCLTNSTPYRIAKFFIDFFGSKEKFIQVIKESSDFELNLKEQEINIFFSEILFFLTHTLNDENDFIALRSNYTIHEEHNTIVDSIQERTSYYVIFKVRYEKLFPDTFSHLFFDSNHTNNIINAPNVSNPQISFKKLYLKFLKKYF